MDCLIIGNASGLDGGGIYQLKDTIESCTIADNHAGSRGGGISFDYSVSGRAVNCLIKGNTAAQRADAVYIRESTLEHCTIVSNRNGNQPIYSPHRCIIRNCIIVDNDSEVGDEFSRIEFTCTDDAIVPPGVGNITNDPQFVDAASGDYRLSATSPCIDAGTNLVHVIVDIEGRWRPLDGDADGVATADMGCYEHLNRAADSDGDTMPDGFEVDHGFNPTDPSDADEDADDDGFDNKSEWIALTDPTDSNSYFLVTHISSGFPVTVHFDSSTGRLYTLQGIADLAEGTWSNISGAGPRMGVGDADAIQDTNHLPTVSSYRIQVELP